MRLTDDQRAGAAADLLVTALARVSVMAAEGGPAVTRLIDLCRAGAWECMTRIDDSIDKDDEMTAGVLRAVVDFLQDLHPPQPGQTFTKNAG